MVCERDADISPTMEALLLKVCVIAWLGAADAIGSSRPALVRSKTSAGALQTIDEADLVATAPVLSVLDTLQKQAVPIAVIAALYLLGSKSGFFESITGNPILRKAGKKAMGGGVAGMVAGVVQVLTLMWLRTVMNYQYRYGGGLKNALSTLWAQGGIPRFYQGVQWAVIQNPLSRFGDTAANTGMLELFAATAWGQNMPVGIRTAAAAAAGSCWRVFLTPVDTLKTTMQVEGAEAYQLLLNKVAKNGITTLYAGCIANAVASFVGNYPWWFTFNAVNELLPKAPADQLALKLLRSALLGISASFVSDCFSNSIRVVKTTKQT